MLFQIQSARNNIILFVIIVGIDIVLTSIFGRKYYVDKKIIKIISYRGENIYPLQEVKISKRDTKKESRNW